jgi:hypothetical protein
MLHFDVMAGDQATALKLATEYVVEMGYAALAVTGLECPLRHQEPVVICTEQPHRDLRQVGEFIVPLSA